MLGVWKPKNTNKGKEAHAHKRELFRIPFSYFRIFQTLTSREQKRKAQSEVCIIYFSFISFRSFLWFIATVAQFNLPPDCSAKIVICKHIEPISINYFAKTNLHAPMPNVVQTRTKSLETRRKGLRVRSRGLEIRFLSLQIRRNVVEPEKIIYEFLKICIWFFRNSYINFSAPTRIGKFSTTFWQTRTTFLCMRWLFLT